MLKPCQLVTSLLLACWTVRVLPLWLMLPLPEAICPPRGQGEGVAAADEGHGGDQGAQAATLAACARRLGDRNPLLAQVVPDQTVGTIKTGVTMHARILIP